MAGLRGLGAEVAKNLALAGVKALTLLDHRQVGPKGLPPWGPPGNPEGRPSEQGGLGRARGGSSAAAVKRRWREPGGLGRGRRPLLRPAGSYR